MVFTVFLSLDRNAVEVRCKASYVALIAGWVLVPTHLSKRFLVASTRTTPGLEGQGYQEKAEEAKRV